eukprot:CAMPEP_0181225268 /NCGR_PEP_ID=MMETSP1096-20121128/31591_1 /TAXON_ID=156174 ORGANISM="Chrysochromulina ericina, Strain CCMP281" /NCGR_SAMPLE_ID=MMETSP1096 /ASSEMBLY_ACC=CAM_ASM_000453 /LENGTH=98 /DNA_ID=CAMNT_0023318449 /DNA_START=46 /DNA_END=343 /DNA_ORIENTATION=+
MSPSKAAQVLEAYSAIASNAPVASSTEKPQLDVSGISNEIAAQQGGFWDVFVMGKIGAAILTNRPSITPSSHQFIQPIPILALTSSSLMAASHMPYTA